MKPIYAALTLGVLVAACSGSPFEDEETVDADTGAQIDGDRALPPGTASPQPDASLFRSEPTGDGAALGDGQVSGVSFDAENDEFTVDGLAFDGDNVYTRGTTVSSLNEYAVYEAAVQFNDPLNQVPINQLTHRAIYGVSTTGNTQFAIVRTGSFIPFGFGGFIYQRNGGVTLPTAGQAAYVGQAAGLVDFDGRGGLEYTTSDVEVQIDFSDFDDGPNTLGDGVKGRIFNRTIFDLGRNDITDSYLTAINTENNASLDTIPDLRFVIGPNVLDNNGELTGQLFSNFTDLQGQLQDFENGTYYGILSGDAAEEFVGIYVVTSNDNRVPGATQRETGGFIVLRQ